MISLAVGIVLGAACGASGPCPWFRRRTPVAAIRRRISWRQLPRWQLFRRLSRRWPVRRRILRRNRVAVPAKAARRVSTTPERAAAGQRDHGDTRRSTPAPKVQRQAVHGTEKDRREPGPEGDAGAHAATDDRRARTTARAAPAMPPAIAGYRGRRRPRGVADRRRLWHAGRRQASAAYAGYHQTAAVNGSVYAARGAAVRTSYSGAGMYGSGWYGANPGAWAPVAGRPAGRGAGHLAGGRSIAGLG